MSGEFWTALFGFPIVAWTSGLLFEVGLVYGWAVLYRLRVPVQARVGLWMAIVGTLAGAALIEGRVVGSGHWEDVAVAVGALVAAVRGHNIAPLPVPVAAVRPVPPRVPVADHDGFTLIFAARPVWTSLATVAAAVVLGLRLANPLVGVVALLLGAAWWHFGPRVRTKVRVRGTVVELTRGRSRQVLPLVGLTATFGPRRLDGSLTVVLRSGDRREPVLVDPTEHDVAAWLVEQLRTAAHRAPEALPIPETPAALRTLIVRSSSTRQETDVR